MTPAALPCTLLLSSWARRWLDPTPEARRTLRLIEESWALLAAHGATPPPPAGEPAS